MQHTAANVALQRLGCRAGTVACSYIKREEGEEAFAAGLSAGCCQQLSRSIPHCCEFCEWCFREKSPLAFSNHKSLLCVTGWSSLLCSSPSFSFVGDRGGKKNNQTSSVGSFLGVQGCLSKTITFLLRQLPLELQSHHILSLLLIVRTGFFSFFLFLSFLFHTLFHSTFTMQWESQGKEEGAAHLCPFHFEKGMCLFYVCYGWLCPNKKAKNYEVDFFPKHTFRCTSKINF